MTLVNEDKNSLPELNFSLKGFSHKELGFQADSLKKSEIEARDKLLLEKQLKEKAELEEKVLIYN